MKIISLWARRHKWQARILIILSFVALNCLGVVVGMLMADLHWSVPLISFSVIAGLYLLAFALYPGDQKIAKLSGKKLYYFRKSFDLALAICAFLFSVCIGNRPQILVSNLLSANVVGIENASSFSDSSSRYYKRLTEFSASMKDPSSGKIHSWKERKKLLKNQIREIKKTNELSDGEKVALIILSSLIAIGLLYLVAAAACSLSCNGADGAALLVGIGGTALVIFLLVIAIRAILGREKKRRRKALQPRNG